MKSSICLLAFSASVMLCLPSCSIGLPRVPHQVPFNEAAFAGYGGPGSGTVKGQIAVVGEFDHEFHLGDQTHMTLLPVTAYTTEMVDREIRSGEFLTASDPRLRQYLHEAKADGGGNFVFHNVPPGEYYLSGQAEWISFGEFQYQWACEKIHVSAGQTLQVKVSRDVHIPGRPYLAIWELE